MRRSLLTLILSIVTATISLASELDIVAKVCESASWSYGIIGAAGSGRFAPYYIASNRHGVLTQPFDFIAYASLHRDADPTARFSVGYGASVYTGYMSSTRYTRRDLDTRTIVPNYRHPSYTILQELYADVHYRSAFVTLGLKEHESALLDFELSSGDLVESGNARPIPEVRLGLSRFCNIPFTGGALQIQGEVSYGKMVDNGWILDHFNYLTGHYNTGNNFYSYKRCYFRTDPRQPMSVTFGMQAAALFGGRTVYYKRGFYDYTVDSHVTAWTFVKMLVPTPDSNPSQYYEGNSLGSWDIMARLRLHSGATLRLYLQKPWEDGSGIGWMNGFDGLYGVEYHAADPCATVSGVVIEFLDFTNQSGAIHWAPSDYPGTTITSQATGADNYYNNYLSNSYANFGMSIGTPFLPSPVYNLDGNVAFRDNVVRGFHIAFKGCLSDCLSYRVMGGYRKGWGTGRRPQMKAHDDTSMMVDITWHPRSIAGMAVRGQIAFDAGDMFGNNFGACVTLSYSGIFR